MTKSPRLTQKNVRFGVFAPGNANKVSAVLPAEQKSALWRICTETYKANIGVKAAR